MQETELINAVKNNNLTKVLDLCKLKKNINLNDLDQNGNTALHLATQNENKVIIEALLKNGAKPDLKDKEGNTSLQLATLGNSLDVVKTLVGFGAQVDVMDSDGMKPIHYAACLDYDDVADYLKSVSGPFDLQAFKNRRVLCNVFNDNALFKLIDPHDTLKMASGGFSYEAHTTIKRMLADFLQEKKLNINQFKPILDALNYHAGKDLRLIGSGCAGHIFYATSKLKNNFFNTLTICERGLFSRDLKNPDETTSIWKMDIPVGKESEIENKLLNMRNNLGEDEAKKELLQSIPKLAHQKFKYIPIKQKAFKNAHCYFENLKTCILSQFIDIYGIQKGKERYKEFDIYMHENVLKQYLQLSKDPNKDEIKKTCEAMIKKKKEKLQKLYPSAPNNIPLVIPAKTAQTPFKSNQTEQTSFKSKFC